MISKELFVDTLNKIKEEKARLDGFGDALQLVCSGYPVCTAGDGYLNALLAVLNAVFNETGCPYPTIEWWLFENVEKKIHERDVKTGKIVTYDVGSPEALYDYLVKQT